MKTEPMKHQLVARGFLRDRPQYAALAAEQGTGKTWMLMDDAEHHFNEKRIEGLIVICPKGVHTNWVRREIPTHMEVPHKALAWKNSGTKTYGKELDALNNKEQGKLAIFTLNIDAVSRSNNAYREAARFMRKYRCMMVVDESHLIKSGTSGRFKKVNALGRLSVVRRIASGTLVPNRPIDLFYQFEFLEEGLLGTYSYRSFVAQYAELYPKNSQVYKDAKGENKYADPQIIKTDVTGRPIYKNLAKLGQLIAPHTYRVLKKDCLDLPEKVYTTHPYEMPAAQRRYYEALQSTKRHERMDGDLDIFDSLTVINKLRQASSGYVLEDGEAVDVGEPDPETLLYSDARIAALLECIDAYGEGRQIIVWASYREEIRRIAEALKKREITYREYHGGVGTEDRETAIDDFQSGNVRIFLGTASAGGTGITLTAATLSIYYSSSYSMVERLQSEDRCHRIGTIGDVLYVDIIALDTIDERIARSLANKEDDAAQIYNEL